MTRKHFVALAQCISQISQLRRRKATAEQMAAVCAAANPRFDRVRFFKACGI